MGMSFLSTATATSSILPIHFPSLHMPTTAPSFSFTLRRYRSISTSCPRLPPRLSSSSNTAATNLFSSIASTSRTLLSLLAASLLSLSGVRPLPSLAAPTPLTHEQHEPEEGKKQEAAEEQEDGEAGEEDEQEDGEVQMYQDALSSDPGNVEALKCVLFARMRRTDWGGALRCARRLREAEPGEVEWRLMEAVLHELKGDLADAERLFKEVLVEKPLLVRALHGLALCMHKRLEGPTVFEMLEKALQLAISEERVPEERNIKLLIAQMHVVKGQLDVASEKLQNLINEDPRDFRPHLCQGIVYALLDRKEEADEQFDTYRSLVPDEFPDKSFIHDVILAAKMESKDRLQDFESEFQSTKMTP